MSFMKRILDFGSYKQAPFIILWKWTKDQNKYLNLNIYNFTTISIYRCLSSPDVSAVCGDLKKTESGSCENCAVVNTAVIFSGQRWRPVTSWLSATGLRELLPSFSPQTRGHTGLHPVPLTPFKEADSAAPRFTTLRIPGSR